MRVTRSLEIPDDEIELRFSRSGGPGGQNVNRRATKVEAILDVAGSPSIGPRQRARILEALASRIDADGRLHVVAQDARTQGDNRERALARMRDLLAEALAPPPPPRRATKPSRAAKTARLESKRQRARVKRGRARPSLDD